MPILPPIVFAIAIFASPCAQAAPPAFEEANQLYSQGKFAEAKSHYEQLIASGEISANLFYNLGNAEYRLGAKGRAALEFERALLLQPKFPEARANLDLVRTQTGAKLLPDSGLDRLVLDWPSGVYALLGAIALWLAIYAVATMLFYRWSDRLLVWAALLLGLALAAYSGVALWSDHLHRSLAVVLEPQADARLDALDRSGVAESLTAGSQVQILSERGPWIYCELPGGRRGWLPSTVIGKLQPARGDS